MFENFIGKKVRIRQADNFLKYGLVTATKEDFLILELDDGRTEYIRTSFITNIVEVVS